MKKFRALMEQLLGIWYFIKSHNIMTSLVYTLDHIPSSCIVVMVHVVKGRQYHKGALLRP
jgi:hypothetical protein